MDIHECGKADVDRVVLTMCQAFVRENPYCYFIPEEKTRAEFLKKFMRFRLTFGLKKGRVFVTDDCAAVAIWIKPNRSMLPLDLIFCGGAAAILGCGKEARQRIMRFNNISDEQVGKVVAQPFWHLSPICVVPQNQGKGCGTALLRHGLEIIRNSGVPCYLETQSEKNRDFYQNNGFALMASEKLEDTEMAHYGMVYRP